ncbi:MAG: cytochrome c biogenesis protein CcsA [Spirochaetota bacterium]|nr:cytochrome c biogenesis protein CcsA [Spirochaetota bacterium]
MFEIVFIVTLLLFISTSVFSILSLKTDHKIHFTRTKILFIISLISFVILGIIRIYSFKSLNFLSIASGIWSYFYIFTLLMMVITIYLYFSRWRQQLKSFMAFTFPFITIMMIISIPFVGSLRKINLDSGLTVLSSHILPVHIFITITAELFFFFSFVGSILYLILEWQLKKKTSMRLIYRLPNLETIEKFNQWSISRSFILLSIGIGIGMIMLFISFKSISMGTAKELHIYFSWLIILVIYLIRRVMRITSHNASIINIVLFVIVMFLFIFTNIFITKGFHSFV